MRNQKTSQNLFLILAVVAIVLFITSLVILYNSRIRQGTQPGEDGIQVINKVFPEESTSTKLR